MIYSLSEIDATCKKAARGAGLSWGYAEEIGKATRWLAAHQLPGVAVLAAHLSALKENQQSNSDIDSESPVILGAALCDNGIGQINDSIELNTACSPLLLLPYLAQLSKVAEVGCRLKWLGTHIEYERDAIIVYEDKTLTTMKASSVQYQWFIPNKKGGVVQSKEFKATSVGQLVEEADWKTLETLAHFTYVPATEASRKGAGPAG